MNQDRFRLFIRVGRASHQPIRLGIFWIFFEFLGYCMRSFYSFHLGCLPAQHELWASFSLQLLRSCSSPSSCPLLRFGESCPEHMQLRIRPKFQCRLLELTKKNLCFTTFIPHFTGDASQLNRARKINKRHTYWKGGYKSLYSQVT